jgi:hypothetical protein
MAKPLLPAKAFVSGFIQRQRLDRLTGELLTEMVFTPGPGLNVRLVVRQFAPRPTPALFRQEIAIAPGRQPPWRDLLSICFQIDLGRQNREAAGKPEPPERRVPGAASD